MSEPTRFERLKDAFHALSELSSEERVAALEHAALEDAAFAQELRSLLAAADAETSRLEVPIARLNASIASSASLAATAPEAFEEIPGYRILAVIGRGGSSIVYLADQLGDGFVRRVALKIVDGWVEGANRARVRRWRDEQRILAALEHAGIARLYDAGVTPSKRPYLAMELVEGESILDACRARRLSLEARIRLFLAVLEAVEYAHRCHVVHRDLKPANILVSERGEVKLLDFGIARFSVAEGGDETETQHRAMTPAYASPEQVSGGAIDARSDVYSLGVVLYQLLTERHPYTLADSSFETLERAIREQEPPTPSSVAGTAEADARAGEAITPFEPARRRRELRGDLDAILLKALRKEPAARYASATEFAADLVRHLEGEPVLARRGSRLYRWSKRLGRQRGKLIPLASLAAVVLISLGGALWLAREGGEGRVVVAESRSPWFGAPLAKAALPSYREGLAAFARLDSTRAIESLRAAVAADGEQAVVRSTLALALSLAGHDALARAEGQKALASAGGHDSLFQARALPRESRLLVEAVAAGTSGRRSQESDLLRTLWLLQPNDAEIGLLLSARLTANGESQEGLAVAEKVAAMGAPRTPSGRGVRRGDDAPQVRAELQALEALRILGRPNDLLARAPKLVTAAESANLPMVVARALLLWSWASDAGGDVAKSRDLAARALALYRHQNEAIGMARAHLQICTSYLRERLVDPAEAACLESLRLERRAGHASGVARVLNNLGIVRDYRGEWTKARETIAEALAIERGGIFGDVANEARYLFNLANLDSELGRLNDAEESFRRLATIDKETGDALGRVRALGGLALTLRKKGELAQAEAALDEADRELGGRGSERDRFMISWIRGDLASHAGDAAAAREWYDRTEAFAAQAGRESELPRLRAMRLVSTPPTIASCTAFSASARELERLQDPLAEEFVLLESSCWSEAGSLAKARFAVARVESKLETSAVPERRVQLALARAAIAVAEGDWQRAQEQVSQADAECRAGAFGELRFEVRLLAVRLALARGDHPERVRVLAEELIRDANAKRFGRIAQEAETLLHAPRLRGATQSHG